MYAYNVRRRFQSGCFQSLTLKRRCTRAVLAVSQSWPGGQAPPRDGLLASAAVLPFGWLQPVPASPWGSWEVCCRCACGACRPQPGWCCRCWSCLGTAGRVATAHRGPGPKPTRVTERISLSREPNPATEKTAGKTPIGLNEIRIRPSATSFQFIS